MKTSALLMLCLALGAACASQSRNVAPVRPDAVELAELAAEDQKVRSGGGRPRRGNPHRR